MNKDTYILEIIAKAREWQKTKSITTSSEVKIGVRIAARLYCLTCAASVFSILLGGYRIVLDSKDVNGSNDYQNLPRLP